MALEGEQSVVAHHAAAVVGDADEAAATGFNFDADAGGAGIEGVLQQLLDDGGGAVDDLAGGDLVGNLVGENADAAHAGSRICASRCGELVQIWTPKGTGTEIARGRLTCRGTLPKSRVCGFAEGAAMDVDRISAMGGVGQEQNPAWMRGKMRRRKFAEDVEPEVEGELEAEPVEMDEEHDGVLDLMA